MLREHQLIQNIQLHTIEKEIEELNKKRTEYYTNQQLIESKGNLIRDSKEIKKDKNNNKSNKLSYKLKLELAQLPSKVEALELTLEEQQALVNDPEFFKTPQQETQAALNQLAQIESELETAFARWEELEELQNQQ